MDNSPADASVPRQCPQGHPSDTPALGIVLVLPQLAREHVCREQQDLIADVDPLLMPIARNATVLSWPARSHAPQADEAILRDANPRRDLANARRYRVAHARWLRRRQAKPLLDGPHQVRREQHGWHGIASVGSSLRIVPTPSATVAGSFNTGTPTSLWPACGRGAGHGAYEPARANVLTPRSWSSAWQPPARCSIRLGRQLAAPSPQGARQRCRDSCRSVAFGGQHLLQAATLPLCQQRPSGAHRRL